MGEPKILRVLGQDIFSFQVPLGLLIDLHKLVVFEKSFPTKSESMTISFPLVSILFEIFPNY